MNRLLLCLKKILQSYLILDPQTLLKLDTLSGKILQLTISELGTVYLIPHSQGIDIKNYTDATPHAEIKGSFFTLIHLYFSASKVHFNLPQKLEIKGDLLFIQQLKTILQSIDIDWEEQLSHITGDVLAHQMGIITQSLFDRLKKAKHNLKLNITDYLQEEIQLLPAVEAVEDFYSDISQLRDATDRLVARLETLKKNRG